MTSKTDAFAARAQLKSPSLTVDYFRLGALASQSGVALDRLPFTVKILLENVLRHQDKVFANANDVLTLARWDAAKAATSAAELPFLPSRVVLQDFTGVPAVVDLAAMRAAVARAGGDPQRINPLVPADLVIDHSVQVDEFGSPGAFAANVAREHERNRERYLLLRWGQKAFKNFRVVPPGTGIVHQVNLEFLASVVDVREEGGATFAFPDTLVGTDSHTTMINGLGVLGWGVGGIEAEAVLLGQPLYQLMPIVVGCRLTGKLPAGTTATDLVLTVTQVLRKHGVVGKFVEFFGEGCADLGLADRATLANMAPEYGATAGIFPVDDETLRYLRATGRESARVDLVERYCKEQGLFRVAGAPDATYSEVVSLDLGTVEPSLAGPRRPQDRAPLGGVKASFRTAYEKQLATANGRGTTITTDGRSEKLTDGGVVIAAITSCTNTSNPSVMLAAGLLAKKAVARGLKPKPYVKTSLAPGSRVVTEYLRDAGVQSALDQIGFNLVGYGCTTCIGNSGPLPDAVGAAVKDHDLVVSAVLSGNRNFEGRIHPQVRAAYLASPPLVVAYALAGSVDTDLTSEPLGTGSDGKPVFLKDVWPTNGEVREAMEKSLTPELFRKTYGEVFTGDPIWQGLPVPEGDLYAWDADSTYIQEPPFFAGLPPTPRPLADIVDARVLALLGDSVTTDHISPAGSIPKDAPAGRYLQDHGVTPRDFNSFGARRGNHQVMMRGTFGNVRLRNEMVGGKEGDWTRLQPSGEEMRIFEASQKYQIAGTPLLVIAGKEYGSGSSRDWAAKGTLLLGVKAVIAESYERIHRSNLVGMGVVPLQFKDGESRTTHGLDGTESYALRGIATLAPRAEITVEVTRADKSTFSFRAIARVDSPIEVDYLRHGGILQMVLRTMTQG
jgi:aconitate hydratase